MAASLSIEENVSMFKSRHRTSHLLKIDKFSLLKKYEIKEVESSVFTIGGLKLKLILYPNGNERDNGNGHISIYLEFQGSGNARFRFQLFVVSQQQQHCHSQGTMNFIASIRRKEGSPRLISLADLETKGYLIGDCCLFGVKLLGIKEAVSGAAESFSLTEYHPPSRFTWQMKYSAFSPVTDHMSDEFVMGNRKWRIQVYPGGDLNAKGKYLSVNLMAKGFIDNTPKTKTYANYTIRVLNPKDGPHHTKTGSKWFSEDQDSSFGWSEFMDLRDVSGYLVDNVKLNVGVEMAVVSISKYC